MREVYRAGWLDVPMDDPFYRPSERLAFLRRLGGLAKAGKPLPEERARSRRISTESGVTRDLSRSQASELSRRN